MAICSNCSGTGNINTGGMKPCEGCGGGGQTGGGCLVTTACCKYYGLPDDCKELETLRVFRDSYLLRTRNGCAELETYYKIAPEIIEKLEACKNKAVIYMKMTIDAAVALIESGEFEVAHRLDAQQIEHLAELYAVGNSKSEVDT